MKGIALASMLVGLGVANAMAADMAVKVPVPPAPVFNWAGFYAGGNVGYSWGESANDWNVFAAAAGGNPGNTTCAPAPGFALCVNGSDKARLDGFIGGLQAGYNWISGKYLLGLEADLQYSDQRRSQVFNGTFNANAFFNNTPIPGSFVATYSESLQWLGTLRGAVGICRQPLGAICNRRPRGRRSQNRWLEHLAHADFRSASRLHAIQFGCFYLPVWSLQQPGNPGRLDLGRRSGRDDLQRLELEGGIPPRGPRQSWNVLCHSRRMFRRHAGAGPRSSGRLQHV